MVSPCQHRVSVTRSHRSVHLGALTQKSYRGVRVLKRSVFFWLIWPTCSNFKIICIKGKTYFCQLVLGLLFFCHIFTRLSLKLNNDQKHGKICKQYGRVTALDFRALPQGLEGAYPKSLCSRYTMPFVPDQTFQHFGVVCLFFFFLLSLQWMSFISECLSPGRCSP